MELKEEDLKKTEEDVILTPEFLDKVENELQVMKEKNDIAKKKAEDAIPRAWKLSETGLNAVKTAVAMYNTEYGLYATIPMICKGEHCTYATLFPDLHEGLSESGERCPVEVAMIVSKYDAYINELEIEKDDAVDLSILRDVIDYDIQIMRAENRMALEGSFTKDQIVTISENGEPIFQETISKAAEYKDKIQVKRNKSLELLNSTRKDKAGTKLNVVMDPSTYARELLQRKSDLTIEGNFDELEIIPDVEYDDGSN